MNWGLLKHWGKRKDLQINLQDMSSPLHLKYNMNVYCYSHDHNKILNCEFFCYINTKFELSKVIEVKSCIKYNVTDWVRVYSLNIASEK